MKTYCCIALFIVLLLGELHAAELDVGPQDPRAEKLVQQLGDECFEKRTQAMESLRKLGPRAVKALQAGAESFELEIKKRSAALLPWAVEAQSTQHAYEVWEKSRPAWLPGLKEGKLSGLLLGATKLEQAPAQRPEAQVPGIENETEQFALPWLAKVQEEDGHWDAQKFGAQEYADVEQTAVVLLALLGSGNSEKVGRFRSNVCRAVPWLIAHQREDGAILPAGWPEPDGIIHALAAYALCEAAIMANKPDTKKAAQKATAYSIQLHQSRLAKKADGTEPFSGFGRVARSEPDLLTTGLFMLHLKSAKIAGLEMNRDCFNGMISYLDSLKSTKDSVTEDGGQPALYPWVPGGKPSAQATWIAMLCRQFVGYKKEDLRGTVELAATAFGVNSVGEESSDAFFNYIAEIVVFQQQGDLWYKFFTQQKKSAHEVQCKDGPGQGSWDPSGIWAGSGRILTTAVTAMSLEVYYCHKMPGEKKW